MTEVRPGIVIWTALITLQNDSQAILLVSSSISFSSNPFSRNTSTVCWPNLGGRRRMLGGEAGIRIGFAGRRNIPSTGSSRISQNPVATRCGSSSRSSRSFSTAFGMSRAVEHRLPFGVGAQRDLTRHLGPDAADIGLPAAHAWRRPGRRPGPGGRSSCEEAAPVRVGVGQEAEIAVPRRERAAHALADRLVAHAPNRGLEHRAAEMLVRVERDHRLQHRARRPPGRARCARDGTAPARSRRRRGPRSPCRR